ncbi:MAG TPA: hypothetical protein ENH86_02740 [Candidatus Jorgensenbacteria bacterium]|nr:hypothetical protein [Candidatus Jorgensenbacteria bacterium]
MAKSKTFTNHKKLPSQEVFFLILAIVLFLLTAWFVINNFIFLVDGLNKTFGIDIATSQEAPPFDKEGFEALNLVKKR